MDDRVDVELLFNSRSSCQKGSRQLETRCGKESHTRQRGPSGPPMKWTPASGEQERHNVTVITVGSRNYSLCSVSSSLSHATLEQPFRTLAIKWEVHIFVKKSSCVFILPASSCVFLHASVLLLCRYDAAWTCIWEYNITPLQRCSQCILQLQLTGQYTELNVKQFYFW